ncbi:recombinase family protein [Skermanella aerolata]|uniref:recombinase family protein n=1 Tax=Skermanella aerolata TaxID=393310 RepID=UPI003D19E4F5
MPEGHILRVEGFSGTRLDQPGLDVLRDAVRDGEVDIVAILSPDRLARRYAYQVLILAEFRRAGCDPSPSSTIRSPTDLQRPRRSASASDPGCGGRV